MYSFLVHTGLNCFLINKFYEQYLLYIIYNEHSLAVKFGSKAIIMLL